MHPARIFGRRHRPRLGPLNWRIILAGLWCAAVYGLLYAVIHGA